MHVVLGQIPCAWAHLPNSPPCSLTAQTYCRYLKRDLAGTSVRHWSLLRHWEYRVLAVHTTDFEVLLADSALPWSMSGPRGGRASWDWWGCEVEADACVCLWGFCRSTLAGMKGPERGDNRAPQPVPRWPLSAQR